MKRGWILILSALLLASMLVITVPLPVFAAEGGDVKEASDGTAITADADEDTNADSDTNTDTDNENTDSQEKTEIESFTFVTKNQYAMASIRIREADMETGVTACFAFYSAQGRMLEVVTQEITDVSKRSVSTPVSSSGANSAKLMLVSKNGMPICPAKNAVLSDVDLSNGDIDFPLDPSDTLPPMFTKLPDVDKSTLQQTAASLSCQLSEDGVVYWGLTEKNSRNFPENVNDLKDGISCMQSNNSLAFLGKECRFSFSDLQPDTIYRVYYAAQDFNGNYTSVDSVDFTTLGNELQIIQSFSSLVDGGLVNTGTDIEIFFSQDVNHVSKSNGETTNLYELYRAVETAESNGVADKEGTSLYRAKDAMAAKLESVFSLNDEADELGEEINKGISYREAVIEKYPSGAVSIKFQTSRGALLLEANKSYYFMINNIGLPKRKFLDTFTTAAIQSDLKEVRGLRRITLADGTQVPIDYSFTLEPVTVQAASSILWDLILWSNKEIEYDLYELKNNIWQLTSTKGLVDFSILDDTVNKNNLYLGQSMHLTLQERTANPALSKDLTKGQTKQYAISLRRLEESTIREEWCIQAHFRATAVYGTAQSIDSLRNGIRSSEELSRRGISQMGDLVIIKTFEDTVPPYFVEEDEEGIQQPITLDMQSMNLKYSSFSLPLLLNRPGTIYAVLMDGKSADLTSENIIAGKVTKTIFMNTYNAPEREANIVYTKLAAETSYSLFLVVKGGTAFTDPPVRIDFITPAVTRPNIALTQTDPVIILTSREEANDVDVNYMVIADERNLPMILRSTFRNCVEDTAAFDNYIKVSGLLRNMNGLTAICTPFNTTDSMFDRFAKESAKEEIAAYIRTSADEISTAGTVLHQGELSLPANDNRKSVDCAPYIGGVSNRKMYYFISVSRKNVEYPDDGFHGVTFTLPPPPSFQDKFPLFYPKDGSVDIDVEMDKYAVVHYVIGSSFPGGIVPRTPADVYEPNPAYLDEENQQIIKTGKKTVILGKDTITVDGLTAGTDYDAYFVLQGYGAVYSTLIHRSFRTPNPTLQVDLTNPSVWVTSKSNQISTIQYAFVNQDQEKHASILMQKLTPNYLLNEYKTNGDIIEMSWLDALQGNYEDGGSLFDQYANPTAKQILLTYMENLEPDLIDTDNSVLVKETGSVALDVVQEIRCDRMQDSTRYAVVILGKTGTGDNDKTLTYRAAQNVHLEDLSQPLVNYANLTINTSTRPNCYSGTLHIGFDKPLYFLDKDSAAILPVASQVSDDPNKTFVGLNRVAPTGSPYLHAMTSDHQIPCQTIVFKLTDAPTNTDIVFMDNLCNASGRTGPERLTLTLVLDSIGDFTVRIPEVWQADPDSGTTDEIPPVFQVQQPSDEYSDYTWIDLRYSANEDSRIFWVAVPAGTVYPVNSSDPTQALPLDSEEAKLQVFSGLNAYRSGTEVARRNVGTTMRISNLEPETIYDIYLVAQDVAGNYSESVQKVSAQTKIDVIRPEVSQKILKPGANLAHTPYNTDIQILFNENVQYGDQSYWELYQMATNESTLIPDEDKAHAWSELTDALRATIRLYSVGENNATRPVPERTAESAADEDWVIDYSKITMDYNAQNRQLSITFQTKSGALNLKPGTTYFFQVSGVTDVSQNRNPLNPDPTNLLQFTAVTIV